MDAFEIVCCKQHAGYTGLKGAHKCQTSHQSRTDPLGGIRPSHIIFYAKGLLIVLVTLAAARTVRFAKYYLIFGIVRC